MLSIPIDVMEVLLFRAVKIEENSSQLKRASLSVKEDILCNKIDVTLSIDTNYI